jgi:hypothetical protein
MVPIHFETQSTLTEDLVSWYAESTPGDTLYITLFPLEWQLRLTRQRCGITWRPPGQQYDVPVWLDQIASWLMQISMHKTQSGRDEW